jgi:hypothetical protein
MFSSIAAYTLAFFVIGPISGLLPGLISMPVALVLQAPKFIGITSSICTAFIAYYLAKQLFGWLDVHYAWYSFLLTFIPGLFNDLNRAMHEQGASGIEKAHLYGDVIGCAAVLVFFFF